MNAPKQNHPALARFARRLLDFVVRHWPAETRSWGAALAAEIDETSSALDALRWSLGGIMLFTRSIFSSALAWLKLPAGERVPASAGGAPVDPSQLPKRSRLFTAAIIAMTAALFFLPEAREAVSTVHASLRNFQESPSDRRALENLAAQAEKNNDAATLAFVALSTDNPDRSQAMSDRAVSLDPNFVWIYGARPYTHNSGPFYFPPSNGRLERLQSSDPGNAVPYLVAADALAEPAMLALEAHQSASSQQIETLLAGDPEWMAMMDRAFTAARYDGYYAKHLEITRAIWNRETDLSSSVVLAALRFPVPSLYDVNLYSDIKFHQARAAGAAGDLKQAQSLLAEVDSFGQRMAGGGGTRFEAIIGLELSLHALGELAVLDTNAGQTAAAQQASLRCQQVDAQVRAAQSIFHSEVDARGQFFRRRAMLVQGSGILALIAGFAALAGILLLELRPLSAAGRKSLWRKAACFAADYAPATLLVASAAFLVSFLPYAQALADYRSPAAALPDQWQMRETLWSLFPFYQYLAGPEWRLCVWSCITIVLAALAAFIVVRSFHKSKRVQPNHV